MLDPDPSTPVKQQGVEQDKQELPSCLKSSEKSRLSPYNHRHSTSQVRFSLPLEDDSQSLLDEDEESMRASPTKVVFPKGSEEDLSTHFVDLHNKIMVDVPDEIWRFHNERNMQQLHKTSAKGQNEHRRTQSLQSVIADTIQSYQSPAAQNTHFQSLSCTSPRLKPSELYLRSDSPLNKYKVPVPLEVTLPPYLSPDKMAKRRESMIYDGEGYSLFLEESSVQEERDPFEPNSSADRSESEESDISIPSASHDYSFEVGHDIDKILGIDEDANVNLKNQARNLLNKSSPKKAGFPPDQPRLPKLPHSQSKMRLAKEEEPPEPAESYALKILSSPSKTITIPDFKEQVSSPNRNSLAEFFARVDCEDSTSPDTVEHKGKDEINEGFKFPLVRLEETAIPAQSIDQNLQINEGELDNSFERRRKMLQNRASNDDFRTRHSHARSRSFHNSQDMFNAQPVSPFVSSSNLELPERSSKRSSIKSVAFKEGLSEIKFGADAKSTPTKINMSQETNDCELEESPASEGEESFSFTSSDHERKNDDVIAEAKKPTVLLSTAHGITKTNQDSYEQSLQHGLSNHKSSSSLAKDFFSDVIADADSSASIHSVGSGSVRNFSPGKSDSSRLSDAHAKPRNDNVTPLSTYNSFKTPLHSPQIVDDPSMIESRFMHANRLSPSRQLSNNRSQSSEGSADTMPSQPSSATSYSNNDWKQSMDVFGYINKKDGNSFVSGRSAKRGSDPVLVPGDFQSSHSDYKVSKEEIGGRLVDIILLDEPTDDKCVPKRRPRSYHEDALQKYDEVLALCDMTADRAKSVIMNLVEDHTHQNQGPKPFSRPIPPISYSKSYEKSTNGSRNSKALAHTNLNSNMLQRPQKYISNLERLRRASKERSDSSGCRLQGNY
ncbi:LAQU0S14e01970g1_1 [Lachancea quebecensis]|uniref:LAQU0S14e01970g1_1 n=1 Tax=Lachancea quebecensis TaxID=1654605 RepID=A0A0P1KW09_9SACH|nr:LAQU0S14e01970g1_1 [Lachancea quebecensis]